MLDSFSRNNKWAMYEFELREHWTKTTISDLKANYDAERNTVLQKENEKEQ